MTRQCDTGPAVTAAAPGGERDARLMVTAGQAIQANARPVTCHFPGDRIAVVYVVGADSQEQARTEVSQAFLHCRYTVEDGDLTNGHAEPFYLWVCAPEKPQEEVRL